MNIVSNILQYLGIALWVFGLYLVFFSHLRGLFIKALKTLWQKKYLLLLAFFAGMTAYGGEVNFLFRQIDTVSTLQTLLDNTRKAILNGQLQTFLDAVKNVWTHSAALLSGYVAIAVLMAAVLAWLIILSQAAVVRIAGRTQQNKPTGLVDGITIGITKFWQLVQLNAIGLLTGWSIWVLLTGVPAAIYLLNHGGAWSAVAYIGSIISIIASVVVIFLVQFATAGIVISEQPLMASIIDSWRLFSRNVVSSLEMAIAIFTVNVTISFLVLGELFFFVSPYTLGSFLFVVAVIVIVYAVLSAFSFAGWTAYYLQLTAGKTYSKLGEWTTKLVNFNTQKRNPV